MAAILYFQQISKHHKITLLWFRMTSNQQISPSIMCFSHFHPFIHNQFSFLSVPYTLSAILNSSWSRRNTLDHVSRGPCLLNATNKWSMYLFTTDQWTIMIKHLPIDNVMISWPPSWIFENYPDILQIALDWF